MNSSLYTADRATHLKIVVVALVAATIVAGVGIMTRDLDLGTDVLVSQQARGPALKVGAPVTYSSSGTSVVR
ncbi:MAG TPA: hypothetical protein VNQ56_05730 [Pseudolabrys sp.]|nr:hypothetical protein [Pseudolabrys sp.]